MSEQSYAVETQADRGAFGQELDTLSKELDELTRLFHRLRSKLGPLRVDNTLSAIADKMSEPVPQREVEGSPHGRELSGAVGLIRQLQRQVDELFNELIV